MSEAARRKEKPVTPEEREDALEQLRELGYVDLADWLERRSGGDADG